jgi:hypothetical protein
MKGEGEKKALSHREEGDKKGSVPSRREREKCYIIYFFD